MKVHVRTFGCRANHYDSEAVRAIAVAAGHEVVDDVSVADLAVFNSCAVTSEAERDLRKGVRRAATSQPRLRSVVMGCASALPQNQEVLRGLPTVERVLSGADLGAIAAMLGADEQAASTVRQSSARAVLRIQDGCDEHCTFCATTLARGAHRSRSVNAIVREAEALAEHHPEIVLTGTHIGSFGSDIDSSLGQLVERLVSDVPHVRYRLSSIEATEVDERLFELLTSRDARIAPHLHAPLQSGSDRLLKRMGRHWYTADSYVKAVERITSRVSVFGLGADIIVGFPGETNDDHAATVALVERLAFTYLHVFTYSPRPGTAALKLPGHVALAEAHARSIELRRTAQRKANEYRARRSGGTADVIVVQGPPKREGLTEDYLTVSVAADRARGERFVTRLSCHSEPGAREAGVEESEVGTTDPSALRASG